jgi:hypothetical protein
MLLDLAGFTKKTIITSSHVRGLLTVLMTGRSSEWPPHFLVTYISMAVKG